MVRLLLALVFAASLASFAHAQPAPGKTRVVVQISEADPARWNLVLNNVRNLSKALGGDQAEIEVVAFGPGIGMLKADAPVAVRVDEALRSGIKLDACQNTMRGARLTAEDMHAGVSYVPSGVAHIVRRQQEGWTYLRP